MDETNKPRIGAHVSAAVSLEKAFDKAIEIGAECVQFFISPPQQWAKTLHDEAEIERYLNRQKESGVGPNFIHSTYLVNLGTANPEHLNKSIDWLIFGLSMASKLEIEGVIVHTGSHSGRGFDQTFDQITDAIRKIFAGFDKLDLQSDKKPSLFLETSAGGGGTIGRNFNELGRILKTVKDNRLKVCLDTQHAFVAGYDIKTLIGINDVLNEFEEEIGLSNLTVIHANDSKTEYKSHSDRHENIGEGLIGEEGFRNLINHSKLQKVPFILEVPGFSGNGPDKENIAKLKSLIK